MQTGLPYLNLTLTHLTLTNLPPECKFHVAFIFCCCLAKNVQFIQETPEKKCVAT